MTWTYPGAPAEFEVVECTCGHAQKIEKECGEDVWAEVRDREIAQLEAMADAWQERGD